MHVLSQRLTSASSAPRPTHTLSVGHFSENWGYVSLAPLLGGNTFSILFGRDLDAHVPLSTELTATNAPIHPRASAPEPGRQCLEGRACYKNTLAVTALACVVSLILSLVAAWRDRRKAKMMKYESLPEEPEEPEELWENEVDG